MNLSPAKLPVYADTVRRSTVFRVSVDGNAVVTLHTNVADFAAWTLDETPGARHVKIEVDFPIEKAFVRPLERGIETRIEGGRIEFDLPAAMNLCVEIEGLKTLFLYANPPETNRPEPDAPGVRFFGTGKVHEVGELRLNSGETLYIEEGAVVKGHVFTSGARGIRIAGRGILSGDFPGEMRKSIVLEDCEDVIVEDIIMIEPQRWMLVLGGCRGVEVRGIKQIGEVMCSDGIDVVGSRDVHIKGCCLRNNDDCVVLKARNVTRRPEADDIWTRDVENVLVEGCVFWNAQNGNAMEIGFETSAARIANIIFRDCDVLCVHGAGAVFSIHNGDRAVVEDVLWEDIRIEHYYDRLVDFRIIESRYNIDRERGHVRRIRLKNIQTIQSRFNPGSSISLIGGFDAEHLVEDVSFEDFYLGDKKALSADALSLHTRNSRNITFG